MNFGSTKINNNSKKKSHLSAEFEAESTLQPPNKRTKIEYEVSKLSDVTLIPNEFQELLFKVEHTKKNINQIELKLVHYFSKKESICILYDSWSNTLIQANDTINIILADEQNDIYHVRESNGLIIINPHMILSGTMILSSLFCMRRSCLNWKFKDTSSDNRHMILGSLLHLLFQESISKKLSLKVELKTLLGELVKRKVIVNQLFKANLNEDYLIEEALVYLDSIENWLREYVRVTPPLSAQSNSLVSKSASNKRIDDFQVLKVCDIEESIWSPKYGLKGNLDLTLQIERKIAVSKQNSNKFTLQTETIPVELKSGRSTFSVEHEGQVMLYSLLNKEKRKQSDHGLLLYLKDVRMKFIKATPNNLKGLIQLRNELVYHISANKWPEVKNDERTCAKCPFLTVCSLVHEKNDPTLSDLYSRAIDHLSKSDKDFFFHWYNLLELEYADDRQFEANELVWVKSIDELEQLGFTIGNLKLTNQDSSTIPSLESDALYCFEFKRFKVTHKTFLKENDMILVSNQSLNQIGVSQGFIKRVSHDEMTILLMLSRNIAMNITKNDVFRIDKINYRSNITTNYNNLLKLMEPTERARKLRELIVDKRQAKFDATLKKEDILKTKPLFKGLNQSQQSAILKTLMAQDYLLIKGYPGTGKTSTIAAMIAVLTKIGKRVLFASFTNSAVDNLLLKVAQDYSSIDFVRVGTSDRIHASLQKFDSNKLTEQLSTTLELKEFYQKKQLVGVTCLSINHPLFTQINFDYCIVDEASQVLLSLCIGPLLKADKFILVGDKEQLPPVIVNQDAKKGGMDVSLFEYLDSKEGSVELVYQYRMNNEIMDLVNEISYEGKLKCLSDDIANKKLKINDEIHTQNDVLTKIFNESIIFVDTSLMTNDLNCNENCSNELEIEISSALCKIFLKVIFPLSYKAHEKNKIFCVFKHSDCSQSSDIGIIAPYNNQIKAFKQSFSCESSLSSIEINTVDQFQGRDKRIIIYSFTKCKDLSVKLNKNEILNDKRRLTVAISRAKEKLVLVGNSEFLRRYESIRKMIDFIEKSNNLVKLGNLSELNL